MKVNLFKSPSTSAGPSRPRTGNTPTGESIRGKISGPIPIPSVLDDDEFPIRHPGSGLASKTPDEEFPIRQRGAGIASPTPLEESPGTATEELSSPTTQTQVAQVAQPTQVASSAPVAAAAHARSASRPDMSHRRNVHTPEAPANPPGPPAPMQGPPARASPASASASTATATGSGPSPTHKRGNPSSTLRYSMVSTASANTGPSTDNKPQRKKSTLRGALSKLFGRRRRNGGSPSSMGDDTERTASMMPTQQRNDASGLDRVKEVEPKRSASLPVTEFDRALRSHSIGPDDMTAIESARNSLQTDTASPSRRRAATTSSSRLFGPPPALSAARRAELGEWGGLSPRPVSRLLAGGDEDPDTIGRAITSDDLGVGASDTLGGGEYTHRRRSRSLSGIDAADVLGEVRRRSDEIRYWRESYGASVLSPVSSFSPENQGEGAAAGDNDNYNNNNDSRVLSLDPGLAPSSSSAAPSAAVADQQSQQGEVPKTPPQPFDFGNLANMSQVASMMKITQAADMESRIGGLESRTQRLEHVVDQLCNAVPGVKAAPLARLAPQSAPDQIPRSVPSGGVDPSAFVFSTSGAPPVLPAVYRAGGESSSRCTSTRHSTETGGDGQSHMSFGEGQTYIGSLHPPSSVATQAHRPTSTSTVRGATSMPALAATAAEQQPDTAAGASLASQLEAERAARAALELQVRKLSERLNGLSSTMYAMVRDPHKSRSHERLTPTSATASHGFNVAAGTATTSSSQRSTPTKTKLQAKAAVLTPAVSLTVPPPPSPLQTQTRARAGGDSKTGSVFDDDDDEDDGYSDSDSKLGETPSEAFMTPREEHAPTRLYGAFGEELRTDEDEDDDDGNGKYLDVDEDDPKRKKAARTLSLSQLTMGKGQKTVI